MRHPVKLHLKILFFIVFLLALPWILLAQSDSLQFIYLANINANYENCRCGANPLGGLDRIAYLIKKIREENPDVVLLDGGDFLNSYVFDELNRLIITIYKQLNPAILVPADQEMQAGNETVIRALEQAAFPLLASNFDFKPLTARDVHYLSAKQTRMAILSFLDKSSFNYLKAQPGLTFNQEKFRRAYQAALKASDFQMAVFHGEESGLASFAQKYPQIDLILLAHSQALQDRLDSHPLVISAGADGEYVTVFTLHFKNHHFRHITLRKIPITLKIPVDRQMESFIQKFKTDQLNNNALH